MRIFRLLPAGSPARNLRLMVWHAPFRTVTFSGAYLPLFLLEKGITPGEILALEAIFFGGIWVLWELPSGWVSDKIGHVRSIQLSGPFAALGFGLYGLSDHFWQFCIMELLIAVSQGLISGSDSAHIRESLNAIGPKRALAGIGKRPEDLKENEDPIYVAEKRWQFRINTTVKASYAVGAIVSLGLVYWFGVASTLVIDGITILIGMPIVMQLQEVTSATQRTGDFRKAFRAFMGNPEVRAFLQLSIGLSTVTYFAVWLTAIYYQQLGITMVLVGLVSLGKQAAMTGLSFWMGKRRFPDRKWWILVGIAAVTTIVFTLPPSWWAVPALLGFDVIRTITYPISNARLNDLIDDHYRASMHSVHTMLGRGTFVLLGLPLQWVVPRFGIQVAMACASTFGLALAATALVRLQRIKRFA